MKVKLDSCIPARPYPYLAKGELSGCMYIVLDKDKSVKLEGTQKGEVLKGQSLTPLATGERVVLTQE